MLTGVFFKNVSYAGCVVVRSGLISRVLSSGTGRNSADSRAAIIHLGRRLPDTSCGLPESMIEAGYLSSPIWPCSRWGLQCRPCHQGRGELLPRRFTLARNEVGTPPVGGLFSVALSVGLPLLGVTQHPALGSSDFPHLR